ncbi:MAG: phage terminase small subunit, partial [Novosphingobium sp.]
MSLAKRRKEARLAEIAAEQEHARLAEVERAKLANNAAPPAAAFAAGPTLDIAPARQATGIAQRRRQEKLARAAIEGAQAGEIAPERDAEGPAATEYELLMAQLGEDMRRLKDIQSTEGKIAAKRDMIDRYTSHVDATLAAAIDAGTAVQDELLVNIMIWRLDIGDYDRGLDIAEHVLRFGLRLPERFLRTPATIIAEEVAEAALTSAKTEQDFAIPVLQRTAQLTAEFDMPDVVRAKLAKATGLHFLRTAIAADEQPDSAPAGAAHAARKTALVEFRRALELDRKIGVIKDIERLEAWLKKQGP